MLRHTPVVLWVCSTQRKRTGNLLAGKGYGRTYTKNYTTYSGQGWGISMPPQPKDRTFKTLRNPANGWESPIKSRNEPLSNVTRTLSPHWRPFALEDGGVLFLHPTVPQVMKWGAQVLKKENAATGMTTMDEHVNAKIQSIIAGNTLEHISLGHWRRQHIRHLLQKHAGATLRTPGKTLRELSNAEANSALRYKGGL